MSNSQLMMFLFSFKIDMTITLKNVGKGIIGCYCGLTDANSI